MPVQNRPAFVLSGSSTAPSPSLCPNQQQQQQQQQLKQHQMQLRGGKLYPTIRIRGFLLRKQGLLVIITALSVLTMVPLLLLHFEYTWVYQRCLVYYIAPSTNRLLVCQEAWSHMLANQDPTLLWTSNLLGDDISDPLAIRRAEATVAQALRETPPIDNVHVTLTAPLDNASTRDLAKCSIESVVRLCASCRLNIWVVDQAAMSVASDTFVLQTNQHTSKVVSYLQELVALIHQSTIHPNYCIRIIDDPLTYKFVDVPFLNFTSGCPPPTNRSNHAGRRIRRWLASDMVREHQIPEHSSDAWRLVALLEWGGLYLDLDVIPLSHHLFQLPFNSVPVQHRVGAYRVNGGVMRLGDDELNERHRLTGRLGKSQQKTFLQALEDDHMYWAPILASIFPSIQKYGFLGPASLTRVYTARAYSNPVTILPEELIESNIDEFICARKENSESLAAHFSGKVRHETWTHFLKDYECLDGIVQEVCPRTRDSITF